MPSGSWVTENEIQRVLLVIFCVHSKSTAIASEQSNELSAGAVEEEPRNELFLTKENGIFANGKQSNSIKYESGICIDFYFSSWQLKIHFKWMWMNLPLTQK